MLRWPRWPPPPPTRPAPAAPSSPGGLTGGSQGVPDPAPAPVSALAPESAPTPALQPPSTCWNAQTEADASPPTADEAMDETNEGREEGELNELEFPPLGENKKRGRGSNSTPPKKQVEKKMREAKSKSQSGSSTN